MRLRRLQRSVDSLDPVPPSDVPGTPAIASPLGADPPPVVLSGVPPIAPLANQSDEGASRPVLGSCEESSSVDVRDNQLDEFASQSILANVSVDHPVSASAGSFGIQIGSSQLCSENQIPNSTAPATSVVSSDNDSLVTVSEGEITSNSDESSVNGDISEYNSENSNVMANASIAKVNISESNVMENTSTTKAYISESSVIEDTSTTKANISESNAMESISAINENSSNAKNSNVNDNVSNSENVEIANSLTNSGTNLVSPGPFLLSVIWRVLFGCPMFLRDLGCRRSLALGCLSLLLLALRAFALGFAK